MKQYHNGFILIRGQEVGVEVHVGATGHFSRGGHKALLMEPLCVGVVHLDREADRETGVRSVGIWLK